MPERQTRSLRPPHPRLRTNHASRAFLVSGQAQQGFSGFFSCDSDGAGLAATRPGIFRAQKQQLAQTAWTLQTWRSRFARIHFRQSLWREQEVLPLFHNWGKRGERGDFFFFLKALCRRVKMKVLMWGRLFGPRAEKWDESAATWRTHKGGDLLVFPSLLFSSVSLRCSLKKASLSRLPILWNSAFRWVYLPFLLCFSLLFFSQLFVRLLLTTTLLPSCRLFFSEMILVTALLYCVTNLHA